MLVQVTTDNHITASEKLSTYTTTTLEASLDRFGDQLTRVEVHLADENSHKTGGADKRCTLEAQLKGLEPIVTTASGAEIDQAIDLALEKLVKAIDSKVGKLANKKGRTSFAGD